MLTHNPKISTCTFAGGVFLLVSLRTPPNMLPLLGMEWEPSPEAEEGLGHSSTKQGTAAWTLAEFNQVDGGQAAQQQRLNLYVFRPA